MGPAYAELALIEQDRFNYTGALQSINQGLELSPDDPLVIPSAMYITRYLGDPRKALVLADRLVQLDPLEPPTYTRRADVLMALRRYPDAIKSARKSLQLAPERSYPHQVIGDALTLLDRLGEAKAEYEKVATDDVFRLSGEAIVAARSRDTAAVAKFVEQIRQLFADAASYQYGQIYAQARDNDRAFTALSKALAVKDPGMTGVRTDPFLDPIRNDPRYTELVNGMNFPQVV